MQDSLLQYFGECELSFDQFVIHTPSGQVLKYGAVVKLEPQVFTLLLLLIRHKEHIVSRDEIVESVWGDRKVSDDAIRALVKKLRIALGDDARAPMFVKTVPLQGYLFIMPVRIESNQSGWWWSKYAMSGAATVIIIMITLLVQDQFTSFQVNDNQQGQGVSVFQITPQNGIKVSPYLSKNNHLLFSYRGVNDKYLNLYLKEPNSSVTKRITWDNADYMDGLLSSDASHAIVKKQNESDASLWLLSFDNNLNVTKAEPIELNNATLWGRMDAISYSHDDLNLYLLGKVETGNTAGSSLSIAKSSRTILKTEANHNGNENAEFDLSEDLNLSTLTQSSPFVLMRYNIESKLTLAVPLPMPQGARIIDAKESTDGQFLAVLASGDSHADIHILELASNAVKFVKRVPIQSNSIVWAPDNTSISFSTESGELLNLNIAKQRLYRWTGLPINPNKVVSQCGQNCFVAVEREPELTNIVERPFAFNTSSYISATQFSLTSSDRFPSYFDNGNGIYFLSLTKYALAIQSYMDGRGLETIYELPKTSDIKSFVLSPDEKQFAGELDGRIFVYNLAMRTLSFLSSAENLNMNPVWLKDKVILYQRIENGSSMIYAHDLVSNSVRLFAKDLLFVKPLNDAQWLLVDEELNGYLYKNVSSKSEHLELTSGLPFFTLEMLDERLKFSQLDSINNSGFDVVDNNLYFIASIGVTQFLHKIALDTAKHETSDLGSKSVLTEFDIHPDMQRMLLVESSLSYTKLFRVDGLTLAPRQINQVVTEIP